MPAYLDNSATTRPSEAVARAVQTWLTEGWYNPSALYRPAMETQKQLEDVRKLCLQAVRGEGHRVIFTSGGTEADNLALLGTLSRARTPGRVLISSVEHPAVSACREAIERLGHTVEEIPVNREGRIDPERLEGMLDERVLMLAVMQVNNETGAVQPLADIVRLRNRLCPGAAIHVDGVQGFLRVPLDFQRLGIQSYALSGHKIQALKGIGALVVRKDHPLRPVLYGGGQENALRSGTENTLGILSLGEAIRTYDPEANERMRRLKNSLWTGLKEQIPEAEVNGPAPESAEAAPHILNVSLFPVRSQTMLFALEGDGIYVSAGSACASRKQKVSPVLKAMGLSTERADCALRFSLSPETAEQEIAETVDRTAAHYRMLKKYVRR